MSFTLWRFWGLLLLYCIASIGIFIFTSSGWTMFLFTPLIAGIFYGSLLVLAFIVSLILYMGGLREIIISRKSLQTILVLQALAVLLNPGDCGDSPGGGPFIFRILLPENVVCQSYPFYLSAFLTILSIGALVILTLAYLWLLGKTYWEARPIGKTRVAISLAAFYSIISIGLMLGIIQLAWVGIGENYRREISRLQIDSTHSYSRCNTYNSNFSSTKEYCEFLLKEYGYSFKQDKSGYYVITGRSFSTRDFLTRVLKSNFK